MVVSKVTKAVAALNKSIEDEIIEKIKKLELDNEEEILESILKKKSKPKRLPPITPEEKQCNKTCKSGKKCTTAKCYKESCWAHLNKELRDEYKKSIAY